MKTEGRVQPAFLFLTIGLTHQAARYSIYAFLSEGKGAEGEYAEISNRRTEKAEQ